jgi:hypothetical protein
MVRLPMEAQADAKAWLLQKSGKTMASHLHDYTHGTTSEPLSILAIVFSALIHDVGT